MELLFVHQFQRKCKEAGWERSAHDSRVLNDALNRPRGLQIPEGRYYLGDAGYGVRKGVISPHCSVRYHLNEFSDNPPRNGKELFNLRHSSLCTTIECCFGILKKRFRVLDAEPFCKLAMGVKKDTQKEKDVKNFRTLKGNWNTITELRQKSGFGWNDDLKMITYDRNVYDEAARPSHANFLNKKIEMYDELALVVGKDMVTGSFSKGVTDVDVKGVNDVDESASNTIDLDNDLEEMGKIASAIQEASLHCTNFFSNLYEEVMKIKGFEESMLASAFDHLNENEILARCQFMIFYFKYREIQGENRESNTMIVIEVRLPCLRHRLKSTSRGFPNSLVDNLLTSEDQTVTNLPFDEDQIFSNLPFDEDQIFTNLPFDEDQTFTNLPFGEE
uniref:DDE Tnp4 domain-containing protein n=1 Tax=Fagus sylvatica TaxID=28930 RepID=A0A2N9FL88_FAGSY